MRGIHGTLRTALLAALLAAALAVTAPAWANPGTAAAKPGQAKANPKGLGAVDAGTGIVQAVLAHAVVVRQLDGRIVRVRVAARTQVFVNGVRAALGDVKPGFVVQFAGPGRVALVLRAQDPSAEKKAGAAVASVSADAVIVTTAGGSTLTIAVDTKTRVFVDGRPATLADVRPGDLVVGAGGAAKKPVRVLRLRRPG